MSLHRGQRSVVFNVPVTTSRPGDADVGHGRPNFYLTTRSYQTPDYRQKLPSQNGRHRTPPIHLQPPTPQWARQPHYQKTPVAASTAPSTAAATRDTMSLDTLNAAFFRLSMEDLVLHFSSILTYLPTYLLTYLLSYLYRTTPCSFTAISSFVTLSQN